LSVSHLIAPTATHYMVVQGFHQSESGGRPNVRQVSTAQNETSHRTDRHVDLQCRDMMNVDVESLQIVVRAESFRICKMGCKEDLEQSEVTGRALFMREPRSNRGRVAGMRSMNFAGAGATLRKA